MSALDDEVVTILNELCRQPANNSRVNSAVRAIAKAYERQGYQVPPSYSYLPPSNGGGDAS